MSAQRHRIRRQVLEVTLQDQAAAWALQSELSRIQQRCLEAIIDRACTEASDPERVHRIGTLEVDLGQIDLDHLEEALIEKLGPRLREALTAQIREEDEATTRRGGDSETIARLELLAFFAHTGNLPWWADASRPRPVDEALGLLLQRAARPLVALVRTISRAPRELRRVVIHCGDERLWALLGALITSSPLGLAERPAELGALLRAHGATPRAAWRTAVWVAVLRVACIEESGAGGSMSFWRSALAHVALELGVTYGSLLSGLHEERTPSSVDRPDPLGEVVQRLVRETRGETLARDSLSRDEELVSAPVRLPAEVLGEAQKLLQEAIEEQRDESDGADAIIGSAQALETMLDRLERSGIPLRALFAELRSLVHRLPAHRADPVLDALRDLDQQANEHGPHAPETTERLLVWLRRLTASRWLPARALERGLESLEEAAEARLPSQVIEEARWVLLAALVEADGARRSSDLGPDKALRDDSARPPSRSAEAIEAILDRLERSGIPLRAFFAELRSMVHRLPAHRADPVLDALRDLDQQASERGPHAPETAESLLVWLRQLIASRWLPARALERGLEALAEAADARLPPEVIEEARSVLLAALEEAAGARRSSASEPIEAMLDRLERSGIPLRALFAELRSMVHHLPAHRADPVLDALWDLDQQASEHGPHAPETAESLLVWLRRLIASRWLPARALERGIEALAETADARLPPEVIEEARSVLLAALEEATGARRSSASEPIEAMLDRLERSGIPLRALFAELRSMVHRLPAHRADLVLDALRDLDRQASEHGPHAPETARSLLVWLRRLIASRWLPARALERGLAEIEQAASASLPSEIRGEAQRLLRRPSPEVPPVPRTEEIPLDLVYGDADEVYVENAGLVVLWPFLGHLFERLGLMVDKQFNGPAALHRAVGLLEYLATEDIEPPEHRLALPKVLCGMKMLDVFEFGDPVTEAEAEECASLLTAVIANAPILKDMSIAGFRGSFLIRKGVLSARDGAWLLRVERASYDVVLDRFPWGTSWVKLPWMEAPLCVEW